MAVNNKFAYKGANTIVNAIKEENGPTTEIHVHGQHAWFDAPSNDGPHTIWLRDVLPWWRGETDARTIARIIQTVAMNQGLKIPRLVTTDFSDESIDDYMRPTFVLAF